MHISSCKEVFMNLLVRKMIYDYICPVDLENNTLNIFYCSIRNNWIGIENNERSCEYSAITTGTCYDIFFILDYS